MSVCVVGAGIIGLPTALEILESEPRAQVTLISEEFSPDTTGDLSAGFWRPFYLPDPRTDLINRWGDVTFKKFDSLWREDPDKYGVISTSGCEVYQKTFPDPFWKDTVLNYQRVKPRDLDRLKLNDFKDGVFYTTYCLEPSTYLPVLLQRFHAMGGKSLKKKVSHIDELGSEYAVVVNCTGLGAKEFVADDSCFPIRGQVMRVQAPFARHFCVLGDDYYLLPNRDTVILGGTHQENDWNLQVSSADSRKIWNNLTHYLPWLKGAKVLKKQVGLRPGRPTIRLESEVRTDQSTGNTVAVVHNYGHGGSGVTLHHGCALDAAQLAVDALHRKRSKM